MRSIFKILFYLRRNNHKADGRVSAMCRIIVDGTISQFSCKMNVPPNLWNTKFYAIHVSPSEKELRAMGNTEQEQAEAMKRYIREVVIPEYARNFNKGLSAEDIKFYCKIHFSRNRSNNELNMHCHLTVRRKDQSNKKKLSPLTNHKNPKKGTVKGGFDRKNLFRQAEQRFDRLFGHKRELTESFEYYNNMKNGMIDKQLKMQEQTIAKTTVQPLNIYQNTVSDERKKKQAVKPPTKEKKQ